MNVRFTGRHLEIPADDLAYAEKKLVHLERFHSRITDLEVRVGMDGGILERVELEAGIGHHHRAVAAEEGEEFRGAFDAALKSLRRQLLRDKEVRVEKRRRGTRAGAGRRNP